MLTATAHCQFLQGLYWLHPAHQGAAHGIRHSGIMRLGKHTEVQPGPHLCPGHTWGPSEAQPALGKGRTHLKNRKGKGKKKKKTTTNKRTLYLHKLQKKKKKRNLGHRKNLLLKRAQPPGAPSLNSPLRPSSGAAGVCSAPRHGAGVGGGSCPSAAMGWEHAELLRDRAVAGSLQTQE